MCKPEPKGLGECLNPSDIAGNGVKPQAEAPQPERAATGRVNPWKLEEEPGAYSPHPDEILGPEPAPDVPDTGEK